MYKIPFDTSGHICETFTIKMFTENIYHQVQVLLAICEKFPSKITTPLASYMVVTLKIIYMHAYNYTVHAGILHS